MWWGAACASGGAERSTPLSPDVAGTGEQGAPLAIAEAATTAEDSLADQAALEALHDLRFGSLGKGSEHVRGVLSKLGVSSRTEAVALALQQGLIS